ncbi:MAG TPA: alpha/beta hydrolase [Acidimicrobiales bacterium]|nr:alpha/beta hydrolase [Acidimicrobiales bacterium]
MSATPVWFGPDRRPLFGILHVPDSGTARAGVVLCSPFGREDLYVYSTYRALAERLEELGLAVLRFDYDGTGDSAGTRHDPGRVAAWRESTRRALDLMRGAGPTVVAAVGMRMGATMAALEAAARPLDALVLWDPCVSGRAFLREQQALQSVTLGPTATGDGSVLTPGFLYDAETAAGIKALDIRATSGHLATHVLCLTRPDRPRDAGLFARLEGAGALDQASAEGQDTLLNVDGQKATVPESAVFHIAAWLSTLSPAQGAPFDAQPFVLPGPAAVVGDDGGDRSVVERPVRIGDAALFGIVTEPEDGPARTTVVCFNTGRSRRIGPSRLWVELARKWAADGLRTVRVDMSGLGESGLHPGQPRGVVYPPEAPVDVAAVARAVAPEDPSEVVLVGLCSGAFHAVEGGAVLGARGVVAVNPVLGIRPIATVADPAGPAPAGAAPPSRAGAAVRRAVRAAAARPVAGKALGLVPDRLRGVLDRAAGKPSPAGALSYVVEHGSDVLVVAGPEEADLIRRGSAHTLELLAGTGRFHFEVIDNLDHAMYGRDDADRVGDILYRHVRDHFAPRPDPAPTPGPAGGPGSDAPACPPVALATSRPEGPRPVTLPTRVRRERPAVAEGSEDLLSR